MPSQRTTATTLTGTPETRSFDFTAEKLVIDARVVIGRGSVGVDRTLAGKAVTPALDHGVLPTGPETCRVARPVADDPAGTRTVRTGEGRATVRKAG
ncbi:hypothetical protein ACFFQW_29645 [Umezawaea endophytica]|uniref:Uncharacterized protein n=1 Tax=Umezawaea endophytica TaxID=1654476 RepID=A0A9X2VF07_9PSEU|nr:hypothetical protein [Umezawaea endophytica]MCS7475280.1 hypothetical protein [Umezawaea endophytica]